MKHLLDAEVIGEVELRQLCSELQIASFLVARRHRRRFIEVLHRYSFSSLR
jgi:hypothetical protein